MAKNSSRAVGRHFLQIPGPTPVPDRVLRAMDTPVIDHRGPDAIDCLPLGCKLLRRAKKVMMRHDQIVGPPLVYADILKRLR